MNECERLSGGVRVAPHWGAWIEIRETFGGADDLESHPTGVRGLKFGNRKYCGMETSRTPLGCVD
ncbi:hypothetical protein PBMCC10217_1493 [Bifidobacterium longum subsp. longum]|nr:hypothetical protein MCC10127_1951 [Bifidobacterium longum subsp. longum]